MAVFAAVSSLQNHCLRAVACQLLDHETSLDLLPVEIKTKLVHLLSKRGLLTDSNLPQVSSSGVCPAYISLARFQNTRPLILIHMHIPNAYSTRHMRNKDSIVIHWREKKWLGILKHRIILKPSLCLSGKFIGRSRQNPGFPRLKFLVDLPLFVSWASDVMSNKVFVCAQQQQNGCKKLWQLWRYLP